MLAGMRIGCLALAVLAVLLTPLESRATSCTAQAELGSLDRDALAAASGRVANAVLAQDFTTLQANLLPQEAADWNGIRATVEQAVPLVKGGHFQLRDVYLLDATDQTATADTQFFCSNATGSLTVTINMTSLPPGRYAVALADAAGATLAGQMGVVLAWDGAATAWKLAGLTVRPGMFDGHDGVCTGCVRGSWQRLILGAGGSLMTRRGTCCCRWIFSPRRICKSCTRSSR
ncbi:MAG: hypothetical protein WDM87_14195 [Terracidiphilus sp.]